jgi:anti-sigma regulatory factor (Ser/Thr protein kinase)
VCRVAVDEFEAALSSPAGTRRRVSDRLRKWEVAERIETSVLLASELVANVVRHTSSRPGVTISVAGGILEVGVTDEGPRLPRSANPAARAQVPAVTAESGRGLLLVEALADEWGATDLPGGKHVWFRLTVDGWPYTSACRCQRPDSERVRLGSGRYALHMPGPDGPDVSPSRVS